MKYASRGIVLSKESFGEADCYIQFYTRAWGLITTLAKSARKSKRRYVGGLDIFCHNEIFLRGDPKDHPYLQELSVLNSFTGIRDELSRLLLAGKITQWVKRLANIATPSPHIYSLLGQTLALIEKESDEDRLELLGLVFKLKLLGFLGFKPRVDSCAKCSLSVESEALFDLEAGGILCESCARQNHLNLALRLEGTERVFLHQADDLRLSQWESVHFSQRSTQHLSRLVGQFASYHTHLWLPV